jgi:lipopolysaccharide transport system ATP-binding protein
MAAVPVISVEGLGKRYDLGSEAASYGRLTESLTDAARGIVRRVRHGPAAPRRDQLWALRDVSFDVAEGELVGVVGRNGAGKTTLLKVLSRITEPTEGQAVLRGRVGSLLEVGTGFHPELSGRENVYLNGSILGMTRDEITRKFDDIVEFAELQRFVDTPVKRYSSGMYVRLAFAVAAFLEPEILFVDEVLSVGDQAFQQRCLGRMGEIATSGRTIFFVSHNLASVGALCTRALLMDGGRLVRDGAVDEVLDHYLSTVQSSGGETLDHRQDRKGDGRLRVTHIGVRGRDGGPARTGDDASIHLRYVGEAPGRETTISIAVDGPLGEPVAFLSNRVTGDALRIGRAGEFVCSLPGLTLLPGRYSLTFYIEVNGLLADWIRNATYFDVFEADLYGTGQLPPTTYGRVAVRHRWAADGSSDDAGP